MPSIEAAIDPTIPAPIADWVDAGDVASVGPIVPEPTPGDPGTAWVPPVFSEGRRIQVLLHDVVTHEPVAEITTARVDDFNEDVELLQVPSAAIHVSPWDPFVEAASLASTAGPDGVDLHSWNPKFHEVSIGINGVARWVGIFREPLDTSPDELLLPARGPAQLFHEDTLGRVEQLDLYEGKGNFELYPVGSTPPGITVPDGVSATIVWDAARGKKCLRLVGDGWVDMWKFPLQGAADHQRSAEASAIGKWPASVPVGWTTGICYTQRSDATSPTNVQASYDKHASRPDSGTSWADDPVAFGCSMSASTRNHLTWASLRAHPDGVSYDVVRLQQGILTGFLSDTDGAYYLERILRDLKSESLGGFPYGITSHIASLTGDEFDQTWNHNGTHPATDVLSAVLDRENGPEAYIDANWRMVIAKRLGQDRTDIRLDHTNLVKWRWSTDPGAQADDFVALTGRGAGTSLITSTVSQPRVANRHRVTKITRAPNDLSLNQVDAWARRHARINARMQHAATATVRWDLAEELAKGDTVEVALAAGRHGLWAGGAGVRMRILTKKWRPLAGLCDLTLGSGEDA